MLDAISKEREHTLASSQLSPGPPLTQEKDQLLETHRPAGSNGPPAAPPPSDPSGRDERHHTSPLHTQAGHSALPGNGPPCRGRSLTRQHGPQAPTTGTGLLGASGNCRQPLHSDMLQAEHGPRNAIRKLPAATILCKDGLQKYKKRSRQFFKRLNDFIIKILCSSE